MWEVVRQCEDGWRTLRRLEPFHSRDVAERFAEQLASSNPERRERGEMLPLAVREVRAVA